MKPPATPLPLAANWKRILARLFDLIFFGIISFSVFYLFNTQIISLSPHFSFPVRFLVANLPNLLFFIIYFVLVPYGFRGQTLGKKLLGIHLQTLSQMQIPIWFYFGRESYILLFPLFVSWGLYMLANLYLPFSQSLNIAGWFLFFWFVFLFIYQKISPRGQLFYDRWQKVIVCDDRIVALVPLSSQTAQLQKTKIKSTAMNSRPPVLPPTSDYLNSAQKQATTSPHDQNLLIIAGPGTGKTTVLIERIAYLIAHHQIVSRRILTLTFTKKACQNIQERLARKFHATPREYPVFTYHGFCYSFLCEEIERLEPAPSSIVVLDEKDRKNLIKQLLLELPEFAKQKRIDKQTLQYLTLLIEYMEIRLVADFSEFCEHMKEFGHLEESTPLKNSNEVATLKFLWKFLSLYKTKKKQDGFLDFWDLLIQTYRLLEKNPALLRQWQGRYDCIVIDEFQDTSAWQYRLVELLSCHGKKIKTTVVGDPDQTIYAWRDARIEFILEFAEKFAPAVTINLTDNYRSTQNIAAVANQLIAFNQDRLPKNIVSLQEQGEAVTLFAAASPFQQAQALVGKIEHLIETGTEPHDIAVLYRSHYLSANLESFLVKQQIPYFVFKGVRFFLRQEIKDMLNLLMLIANPTNFYTEIVLGWVKNIGPATIAKIKNSARAEKMTVFHFLRRRSEHEILLQHQAGIRDLFLILFEYHEHLNQVQSFSFLAKNILKKLYRPVLDRIFLDSERRYQNVRIFLEIIDEFAQRHSDLPVKKQILQFLNETKINTADDFIKNPNSVQLMTIHNAKGLEYENVFIYEVSQGKFPSPHFLSAVPEEERRLFFVGLTRAKKKLFVFTDLYNPSPFIQEIKDNAAIVSETDFDNESEF